MEYQHGGDIYSQKVELDFSANINPLGLPEGVKEELRRCLDRDVCSVYPDSRCGELREALGVYHHVPPSWTVCGNGAADLIFGLAASLRPSRGLVTAPAFSEYEQALDTVKCRTEHFYLEERHGFKPDPKEICARIRKARTEGEPYDIVFLCNPNNPTGIPMQKAAVEAVARECAGGGALLVVDECFCDFLDDPETFSVIPYIWKYQNLFVIKAFTKLYAMAGLRLGYGLSSDEGLLGRLGAVRQPWPVSGPAQRAGEAALREREYVEKTRILMGSERDWLRRTLQELGFIVYGSKANYLFFKDPGENLGNAGHGEGSGNTADPAWQYKGWLYEKLLERGVLIRSCANYPGLDASYYRVCVKARRDNEALAAHMREILHGEIRSKAGER